jgi:BMFP domain-containing protein YqiC
MQDGRNKQWQKSYDEVNNTMRSSMAQIVTHKNDLNNAFKKLSNDIKKQVTQIKQEHETKFK